MELLNPSFNGHHPQNGEITRSAIIQQLSLLVGFLDWVGPNGTNGALCSNCNAVIKSVLDHTLNSTGTVPWQPTDLDAQIDFNFDLMDTFDWLRTDDGVEL